MAGSNVKVAQDLCKEAQDLINDNNFDEAEKRVQDSLKVEETSEAYRHLAVIYASRKNGDKVIEYLERALEVDIEDDKALVLLAEALLESGDKLQAIGHYMLAIKANPEDLMYKARFLSLSGSIIFAKYNPHVEEVLKICLETPGLECGHAQTLWYTTFCHHPVLKSFVKISNKDGFAEYNKKSFQKIKDFSPLMAPFFLLALKGIIVLNPIFEGFLTCLRRFLLDALTTRTSLLDKESRLELAAALSHYCFVTEFIFDVTEDEQKRMDDLRQALETDESAQKDALTVAVYACYAPLYKLSTARDIEKFHAGTGIMDDVIDTQVTEYLMLLDRVQHIETLTAVEDEVSVKVQEQYEEYPYPRWQNVNRDIIFSQSAYEKDQKGRKVLVAGCGTGRESAMYGMLWPESEILAVDISRPSLAYAIMKAEKFNCSNITFKHGDILKLGQVLEPESFDFISSAGVLHHMKDPLMGWKTLVKLLKPNGVMAIGLYSEMARQYVVRARQVIAEKNIPNDREGMRHFRRHLTEFLSHYDVTRLYKATDYYMMSMFRDLLFHVQEHRFTALQIQEALDELGLVFKCMRINDNVIQKYYKMFPDDRKTGENLTHWHEFEQENPDTFISMFQIVCQKKQGE